MLVGVVRVTKGIISGIALLLGEASQANLSAAAALKFGLKQILDFGDLVVSPGLIDTHVHFNEPGREAWEGSLLLPFAILGVHLYKVQYIPKLLFKYVWTSSSRWGLHSGILL